MPSAQSAILLEPPSLARYLHFRLRPGTSKPSVSASLRGLTIDERIVVGLGDSVAAVFDVSVMGLRAAPALSGAAVDIPSTQDALWCWLRGDDRGELLHRSRAVTAILAETFELEKVVDGFKYAGGRDLTGYIDGTENPTGGKATSVALSTGPADGYSFSSFVAVQQWVHDLARFDAMPQNEKDDSIGRRFSDNEELDDAPLSAHVKRTAQESFTPEAFVLRRSMPWAEGGQQGLMFVAFGNSLDAFEAQMRRMVGLDDGIQDALFRFTRPITSAYFWCPPVSDKRLDLSLLK